ncbi:hypothetical protein ZIOFF_039767 [Zingiber officinale]|uniref:dUTP diphosphatase n=1 Tax=Zingiber officinale TaxID=94328 RepID=A0A8J5G2U5_ZINOF|nr:hypothetical protein ZIOFF_039767 [Zingiber officinale]
MSETWERAIQEWYDHSRTSNLEYLDLASTTKIAKTLKDIQSDLKTVVEQTKKGSGSTTTAIPDSLIEKLRGLTLGAQEKPKEGKGKLRVYKDPFKILKEEQEKLKGFRRDDADHRVYIHGSEEAISCIDGQQIDRSVIQPESFKELRQSGMQFVHIGLVQLRLQILHRREEGTLALVIFRGNRWQGDQAIFATMEVDLATGNYLASRGVRALPGRRYNANEAQGHNWIIQQPQMVFPRILTEVQSRNLLNGTISINFDNYVTTPPQYNQHNEETTSDEEEIRSDSQIVAVLTKNKEMWDTLGEPSDKFDYYVNYTPLEGDNQWEERPSVRVKRLSHTAIMPQKRTHRAAGYDLVADKECIIEPRGLGLIPTCLSLELPWGTYGRIATRSNAAWTRGLDVGAGVIDADYRGEVTILIFNHSDYQSSGQMDYPSQRPTKDKHPLEGLNSTEEFINPFFKEVTFSSAGISNIIATGYEEEEPKIELEYPAMKKLASNSIPVLLLPQPRLTNHLPTHLCTPLAIH